MKLEKNDIIEGYIENLGNSGEGVLRFDRFPIFVDFALPGEKVRVKLLRVNDTHGFAKLMEVLEPSDRRQTPPCPYYYSCGGCQLQHMDYRTQLDFKKQRVIDCFERIAGIKGVKVEDTIGPDEPFLYRNKVQLPVGRKNGKVEMGFYRPRTHTITDMEGCLIQMEIFNDIMGALRTWIEDNGIPIYNEEEPITKNQLRHILLRSSRDQSEVMVVPVFTSDSQKYMKKLLPYLKGFNSIVSVIQNVNPSKTNTILGKENTTYYGKDTISDNIGYFSFEISPHSFFQVNPPMTEAIYNKVVELSDPKETDTVFDLYCGAGTISLYVSKYVKKVYGIEIVEPAINDAKKNARRNGVSNAEFILGKAEDRIDDLVEKNITPDLIILDPPRKGCDQSLISKIIEISPKKITYVSCNPSTQARDISPLLEAGYSITTIQPFDNFPNTSHVETVVLMSKVAHMEVN